MREHFSRVKDAVLVAVQRRDAGRVEHEIFLKIHFNMDFSINVNITFYLEFRPLGAQLVQLGRSMSRTCTEPSAPVNFIRKNARAFFSGQGRCPCRGPAARRWSCEARNLLENSF